MARRFSGSVVVEVTWAPRERHYQCRVRTPEGAVTVRVALASDAQARSSESFDEAAKAALCVAENDLYKRGISLSTHALFSPAGEGWDVARSAAHAMVFC